MIGAPEIVETEEQLVAYIHLTIPREDIRRMMDPGINEVLGVLAEQEIEPSGPWFTHHLRIDPEIFDFEICFPVDKPVLPSGRVQAGEWPPMKVARTVYEGPYGGLGRAWKEFGEWIESNGYLPAEDLWERYISTAPRPVRTELNRPLL